jgi:hypothetical protein
MASKAEVWDDVHKAYDTGVGKAQAWTQVHRFYGGHATIVKLGKMGINAAQKKAMENRQNAVRSRALEGLRKIAAETEERNDKRKAEALDKQMEEAMKKLDEHFEDTTEIDEYLKTVPEEKKSAPEAKAPAKPKAPKATPPPVESKPGQISFSEAQKKWDALEVKRAAIEAKWQNLYDRKQAAGYGGIYDDKYMTQLGFFRLRDQEEPAVKREQEAIIKSINPASSPSVSQTPEVVKNLKVGDNISFGQSSGYMGDSGDSRDVGYSITRKVTKVLGRGKYEVEPHYSGQDPIVFAVNADKTWLRDTNYNRLTVNAINGVSEKQAEKAEGAFMAAYKQQKRYDDTIAKRSARYAKVKEEVTADWTKGSKAQLVGIIEGHLAKQGKRMTNLGTATKPRLIEIIRKYKIKE